jgi:CRISPR-associated endonuclease/helicase Cas3
MQVEGRALAVVNTKADALALLDALGEDALHLSTLLCGAHRNAVIAEVKQRLGAYEPCLLVSTQVVEAGVDLDFPLVLRAFGPLDSIIQAAGRCNREGWLNQDQARVIVFRPAEGGLPPGAYRMGAQQTEALVAAGDLDPHDPAQVRTYFERWLSLLGDDGVDRDHIQDLRSSFDYPEVASRFTMIDDDTESVIVTGYGSEAERAHVHALVERLRTRVGSARSLMRQLQPYVVAVRRTQAQRYRRDGFISAELLPGISEWFGDYDNIRGLVARDLDAAILVV